MEITGKVHCFFEQSGTFKNEFIKLGIPAEDYDIQISSPVPAICYLGKVGKKKAEEILLELEKEYKVYSVSYFEIALVKGRQITLHFTMGGGMWNNGQWVQMLNEWDFRKLIAGQKVKTYKAPKPKKITITATERQIKKAKQLFYAKSIGFEITGKDYQKWHLL